ncbi:MAG: Fe-S cluster assembly protein SufB, partial [Clostridium sp.]|nr:Fe-S cluster assembly protein SufB [Clostridium sp.]
MEDRKKTYIEDVDRGIYDIKNEVRYSYKVQNGLTPEIIRQISKEKNEPEWMTEFRLKSLQIYNKLDLPPWGPDITDLDIENIVTYIRPDTEMVGSWDEVPKDIRDTFDRLGIPQAEQKSLAGVGAQYDSEVVYHSIKEDLVRQGVIYTDMESAVREYEDIIK